MSAGRRERAVHSDLFAEAWRAADLEGTPTRLIDPKLPDLPFAVWSPITGWGLVQTRGAAGVWRGESATGGELSLAGFDKAECIALPRRSGVARKAPGAIELVRDRESKEPFEEAGKLVYRRAFEKGLAWVPAGHILRMSPPIVMDVEIAAKGMDLIEDAIARVEKEFGY